MVVGAVLVLVGVVVLGRGVWEVRHVRRLRRDGRAATGIVTGHERRAGGSRAIVVSYVDDGGVGHSLTSEMSSGVPIFEEGAAVTVRYLAGQPDSAWIDERRENARNVLLTVILGLGFAAAGVAMVVKGS
jgi:uncharacterized protein DUF3592